MIVVVGSVNMDLIVRCARLPQPGETVTGHGMDVATGGKGANQAVAAARLGAQVSFVGCVGDDAFGEQALQKLRAEGVDTSQVAVEPGGTGVAMIMVESSGQNCIALHPGANAQLSVARVDASASLISRASMLVCQLESPLPSVRRAIEIARQARVPVLLNPAPAQPLPAELLEQVDVLIPNETEAAIVAGMPPSRGATETAQQLRSLGVRTVIVTLGERGTCVLAEGDLRLMPAQRVRAVDTTGAGDAFVGAYAVAREQGIALWESVAFAQTMAAISVTRPGAMEALPTRRDAAERDR
jgi:ribokinase